MPNIMMWWKLIAALLPMIIALAVQLAGVAVAMGAIAVAGAAVMGLGLIGHGEAIGDSFALARRQMNKFKRELFQTFKPALAEFAPISAQFMDEMTERLEPLADALRGFTIFEASFNSLFEGTIGWIEEVMYRMVEYADVMDQLAHRFGGILGDEVIQFVEFLIDYAYEEQDAMVELIEVFKSALATVLNLLVAFTYFLVILEPLAKLLAMVSGLLKNRFGAVLAVVLVTLYVFIATVNSAAAAIVSLQVMAGAGGVWALFAGYLTAAGGAVVGLGVKVAALIGKLTLMHALLGGVGLLIAGVGASYAFNKLGTETQDLSASRARTRSSGGGTTINNEFHVHGRDGKSVGRQLQDKFPDMYNEATTQDDMQTPTST